MSKVKQYPAGDVRGELCGAVAPKPGKGRQCTRQKGHPPDEHAAHGISPRTLATWPVLEKKS